MATGTAEQPVRVGFAIADSGTAVIACSAILAALLRRERTGQGAMLDVSMLESCIALMGLNYYNYLGTGQVMPRVGPNPLAQSGSAGTFPTKEGTLLVNGNTHRLFIRLAEALGRQDLLEDERFATEAAARANRAALRRIFAAHFRTDSAAHWEAIIRAAGVPCGQLKGPERAVESPQLAHRGAIAELDGVPGMADGRLRFVGAGFTVDGAAATPSRPPPRLGEHSEAILEELGYDAATIAALRDEGALG
jgi:crotonobetainyl-CoA:carnitine CoA-transferase CaiB-like acyl-CoA transferase